MQWIQQIEVVAGGKKFESTGENRLEIEFEIPFNDENEPDVSEITIYNLSDETIEEVEKQGHILVNAGYRELGNIANILTGKIEEIDTTWQGLDKVTKFTASDGGKEWRTASLNKTYKNGTKASQIMRDLANAMGYEVVAIEPTDDIEYKLGKTITGLCSKSLKQLVKDTDSKMFINKNRLVIREYDQGYDIGFVLNKDSGLVGTPTLNKNESGDKVSEEVQEKKKKSNEETEKTWTVTSLLNPRIETDSIIYVDSKVIKGKYRVKSGKHTKDFNTEMVVVEA